MPEMNRDEIAKLEALYASNPEGRVFTHLAEAYRKAGEFDRARAILEQGLAKHPGYASAYVVLGRVFFDLNDTQQATDSFRRVLELDPHNMVALRTLGDIARAAGRYDEALDHFQELRHQDPGNAEIEGIIAELREAPAAEPEPAFAEPADTWEPAAPAEPAEPEIAAAQDAWEPPVLESAAEAAGLDDALGDPLPAVADNLPEFDAPARDYSELVSPDIDIEWAAAPEGENVDQPLPGDLADFASLMGAEAEAAADGTTETDLGVFDISDLEAVNETPSAADALPEFLAEVSEAPPAEEPATAQPNAEVLTETMALLYRDQGLYERSAEVYRALLRDRPGDWALQAGLHEVERLASEQHQPAAPAAWEPAPEAPPREPEPVDDFEPVAFQPTAPEAMPGTAAPESPTIPELDEPDEVPASPWVTAGSAAHVEAPSLYSLADESREEEGHGAPITEYFRSLLSWRPGGNGALQSSFAPAPEVESEPAMLELETPADSAEEPMFEEPVLPTEPEPAREETAELPMAARHLPPAIPADELMPWEEPASPSMPEALPVVPPTAPASAAAVPESDRGGNPVDAAFDEWFNSATPSPDAAFDPLPSLTPPVPPTPAPAAGPPTMPFMPLESDKEAAGEDDDDLEMFRSWLQSLKK